MEKMIVYLEKGIAVLSSIAISGIVIIVFINVVMRYFFNTGLTWSDEVSVNLFVWFIFLGGILASLDGLHLKVDVVTNLFSKKNQQILALLANIFTLIAMGILFIGGIAQVQVTNSNISSATGIPFSYITISMVIFSGGVILLTIYHMIEIVKTYINWNKEG